MAVSACHAPAPAGSFARPRPALASLSCRPCRFAFAGVGHGLPNGRPGYNSGDAGRAATDAGRDGKRYFAQHGYFAAALAHRFAQAAASLYEAGGSRSRSGNSNQTPPDNDTSHPLAFQTHGGPG